MSKPILVFTPPGRETPGYLRRLRRGVALERALKAEITPELVDEMVLFLLDYVTEPVGRDEAETLLWEANEDDFDKMLSAITGSGEEDEDAGSPKEPTATGHTSGREVSEE